MHLITAEADTKAHSQTLEFFYLESLFSCSFKCVSAFVGFVHVNLNQLH